jgi:YVTN family beta-propeller protein
VLTHQGIKIYVANAGGTTVTVIDGNTDGTTSIQVGNAPEAIGVKYRYEQDLRL